MKQRNTLLKITICVLLLITGIVTIEISASLKNGDKRVKTFGREIHIAVSNEEAKQGVGILNEIEEKDQGILKFMNLKKVSYLGLGDNLSHKEVFDMTTLVTVLAIWFLLFTASLLIAKKNQLYVKEGSNEPD